MTDLRHALVLATATLAVFAPFASAQQFLVTDTTNKAVMLVDGATDAVVNPLFLADDPTGVNYTFSLPIEAIQVKGEIWVADQVSDQIVRFDIYGLWIATIRNNLDNLRGLAYYDQRVYVVNNGTGNGAPGKRILVYDLTGTKIASFPTGDLFDVAERNGELLVTNTLLDDIERYSLTGTFLGTFHDSNGSTGIDFPSQVTPLSSGAVLCTGQSPPIGLFRYDANGVQTDFFASGLGNRGIAQLNDGRYYYTSGMGLHAYDPVTAATYDVVPGFAGYYISLYKLPGPPESYCTAGVSTAGCSAQMSSTGVPSASASSGFMITAQPVEAQRTGTMFYGVNGRVAFPWGQGSSSFFCVRSPVQRMTLASSGGTNGNCNGVISMDWNAFAATQPLAVGQPYAFGDVVNAQCWYRDPTAPRGTSLSDALEFSVQP